MLSFSTNAIKGFMSNTMYRTRWWLFLFISCCNTQKKSERRLVVRIVHFHETLHVLNAFCFSLCITFWCLHVWAGFKYLHTRYECVYISASKHSNILHEENSKYSCVIIVLYLCCCCLTLVNLIQFQLKFVKY